MEKIINRITLFVVAVLAGFAVVGGREVPDNGSWTCPEYVDVYPYGDIVYTVDAHEYDVSYLVPYTQEDGVYSENQKFELRHSLDFYSLAIKEDCYLYTDKRPETPDWLPDGVIFRYKIGEDAGIYVSTPDEFTAAIESNGAQSVDQVKLSQPYVGSDELIARAIDNLGNWYIFVSHDFGETWKQADTDAHIDYVQWAESDKNVIYGVELSRGMIITLHVSEDGGESWTALDDMEYRYNTVAPHVKEVNIKVDVCPANPNLILVSCLTPFVYDRSTRTTTFLACSPRVPGSLKDEGKYNARRYGFTNSATPQIMTFDTDDRCLKLSDDLGQSWRECLDMNGKPVFRGSTQGWTRKGNIVYALTYKSSQCAYGTMYLIDLNETDAMAGVETTPDDAVIAGVRVTTSGDAIIVHADTETDIAVYSVDGKLVSCHDDVSDATIPVIPGMYIVQAAGVARKVRL